VRRGDQYVFGYASLVAPREPAPGLRAGVLRGYRRTWNVAMDNSRAIPGYKQYVDPATGTRPNCFVVFLNIVPDRGASVNGAMFRVSADELDELDERERNYERIEVSSRLAEAVVGTVWSYAGSEAGVARYEEGRRTGRAVISAAYHDDVRCGFATLGHHAAAEFDRLTEPPPCPIVPLDRVPLAP
jgi:hypothetical protein